MNKENTKKLFDRFPFFNPKASIQTSLMGFGFACGDGWFDIIWCLSEDIEKILKEKGDNPQEPFRVLQVKEKFAGLRYYTNWGNEEIWKRIKQAEAEAVRTCEVCGKPGGERSVLSWIRTLCDDCYRVIKKKDS